VAGLSAATAGSAACCRRSQSRWSRLPANIYAGLWYPIAIAAMTAVVGFFLLPETNQRDIRKIPG